MGLLFSAILFILGACFGYFMLGPNDMLFSAPWFYLFFIFIIGFAVGRFGTIIEFLVSSAWRQTKQ